MNLPLKYSYPLVIGVSLLAIVAGIIFPEWMASMELGIFICLMVISGIPHGATDHIVYKFQHSSSSPPMLPFFLSYVLAMGVYALIWIAFPMFSLFIFILISAFHFGQSQLLYIRLKETHPFKIILYLVWGMVLLGTILLFHQEESWAIIHSLLGDKVAHYQLTNWEPYYLGLLLSLMAMMLFLGLKGKIRGIDLILELFHLLILVTLSLSCSLLVSFSIYFGLWHSLASIHSEITIIQQQQADFSMKDFFKEAIPYTIISLFGIGILLLGNSLLFEGISPYMLFFIAISTVTLPHMYFMQGFYHRFSPFAKQSVT